ncbi:sodium:solute symporter family protein [Catalinimonas niigatensis]|uniref:sodium:solute symporter family protein n=1 Tax=Catalinimonas niigatensis TaxID=1397264 RepID=UPI002665F7E6|nr:sodium:solute symporter family protein [Catalinimonas niigatensis]WPP49502.1 sodium:solute symporter family protein [Catalinimonas niigatensis]
MTTWIIILGALYLGMLAFVATNSFKKNKNAEDYLLAGSNIGIILGFLTFAATLFSTFTLLGMPDFFRINGIGAWIFLAVSDGGMVFLILWWGYHLRKKVAEKGFNGVAGLLVKCYQNKWAGYVSFAGVFLFLVPYVAIQIRGIAIFLTAVFPDAMPFWGWAIAIVAIMLTYSEIGGLKAIMHADAIQGLTLLIVTWIIGVRCVNYFGNLENMFDQVEAANTALLSTPGPTGLFNAQFLIASFLVILFIPVTQPQLTIRLVIMRNLKTTHMMAFAVGIFAILIILPTAFIGMYGAVRYPDLATADFLSRVLLYEQPDFIAAIAVVGLLAAGLSTTDSQIFALGTEVRSLLHGSEKKVLSITRYSIFGFAVVALIFSVLASDQLVMLARVSFAGTAMLAPMILTGVLSKKVMGNEIIVATAVALAIFILSLLGAVPSEVGPLRLDLLLLMALGLFSTVSYLVRK